MDTITSGLTQLLELGQGRAAYRIKMLDLIACTVDSAASDLEAARGAWKEERYDDAMHQLHGLRGSLGVMGAKHLAVALREIEDEIHARRTERTASLFDALEPEIQTVVAAVRQWIEQQGKHSDPSPLD